jgi:predicted GNAT family acetyltransferase
MRVQACGWPCHDEQVNETPEVVDDVAGSRFVVEEDGQVAELVYQLDGDRLVLLHTGVPIELEGRGIGSRLVAAAFDEAERRGLTVVPLCPFVRDWLKRHPDAAATVPIAGLKAPRAQS